MMMTPLTPNVFAWLFNGLKQSRLARDDLIALIVTQNLLFAAIGVIWTVSHWGTSMGNRNQPFYIQPVKPITEPILILVTKVVTVRTEICLPDEVMHTPSLKGITTVDDGRFAQLNL